MDWIAPTDEELAAITEEEIIGPGDRYAICLGSPAATFPPTMHNAIAR